MVIIAYSAIVADAYAYEESIERQSINVKRLTCDRL